MKANRMAVCLAVCIVGATLGIRRASAQTYYLNGDQQIDGTAPVQISFTNAAGTAFFVTRTGTGTTEEPWTFDFSSLNPAATTISFLGRKLYCATTSGSRDELILDLNGADLSGDSGTSVTTWIASGNYSDNIVIRNVGNIAMGGIETRGHNASGTYTTFSGRIDIGTSGNPAGNVRTDFLWAHATGSRASAGGAGITVYGAGHVHVENATGTLGDINTSAEAQSGGPVTLRHQGEFRARDILAHTTGSSDNNPTPGALVLDGGNSLGNMTVRRITAYNTKTGYIGATRRSIDIGRYANVSIEEVSAYYSHLSGGRAPDMIVTNAIGGNIEIGGPVDLSHGGVEAYRGSLQLACAGTIALAELDMEKVRFVLMSSGGVSELTGDLLNFDAAGSGAGTLNDPIVTTQTALRVPAGQRLLYKVRDGANAALEAKVYRVANESGQAGQGGLLMPTPTRGTVIMFF